MVGGGWGEGGEAGGVAVGLRPEISGLSPEFALSMFFTCSQSNKPLKSFR